METERTLEVQNTAESAEALDQAEQDQGEESENAADSVADEDESLEALAPKLTERQKKELETLTKKAKDFDGLAAKKRKLEVTRQPAAKAPTHLVTEDSIRAVLYKDNEKKALRDSINPKSASFIPELVEDKNFNAIVSYLPRSVDRSSPETIHKALQLATRMWKEDNGTGTEKEKAPEAELVATRGAAGGGSERPEAVKKGRTFLKKVPSLEDWYKK